MVAGVEGKGRESSSIKSFVSRQVIFKPRDILGGGKGGEIKKAGKKETEKTKCWCFKGNNPEQDF